MNRFGLALGLVLFGGSSLAAAADDLEQRELSLADAVRIGIENNLNVEVERHAPLIAREDLGIAWGSFDPEILLGGGISDFELPQASVLAGGSSSTDEKTYDGDAQIGGLVPWLGASYALNYTADRRNTTFAAATLSPEFRSGVNLEVELPLLKNLIWSEPWTEVKRARVGVGEADEEFRARLMDVVRDIEDAYWNLIAASETLRVSEKSVETALALQEQAEVQFEVGVVSRVEVTEAIAGVAEREVTRIRAEAEYENAQDVLIDQVYGGEVTPVMALEIQPTDSPDRVTMSEVNVEEAAGLAFEQRPELEGLRRALEREALNLKFARNQRLPELNVRGSYGFEGLAGRQNPDLGSFFGGGNLAVDPSFGDTEDDFFTKRGNQQWTFRGELRVPIGQVSERHSYKRAAFQYGRAESRLRREEQRVILDIRRSARELEASLEGVEAAERRRTAAQEQLEAERARLENGESTPFEVLQRERDLVEAEEQKIVAQQTYHNSVTSLNRAQGTTLRVRNIAVEDALERP